ncbi:MAG: hypothetical protein ACOC7T_05365 [Planctomycetota bacterium]
MSDEETGRSTEGTEPADRDSRDADPADRAEFYLERPRPRLGLPLLTFLVLAALFGVFCWPQLRYTRAAALVGGMCILMPLFGLLAIWVRILFIPRKVVVDRDGISAGRRSLRWENAERVRPGPPLARRSIVWVRRKRPGFFDLKSAILSAARDIHLPATPKVYRQIVPAMRRMYPDLDVSPKVLEAAESPSEERLWPRLLGIALFGALLCLLGVLHLPALPIYWGFYALLLVFLMGVLLQSEIFSVHAKFGSGRQVAFTSFCVFVGALGAFALAALQRFSGGSYVGFRSVLAFGMAVCVAGGAMVWYGPRLGKVGRAGLGIFLLLAPVAGFALTGDAAWRARDIGPLLAAPGPPPADFGEMMVEGRPTPFWGSSGRYMATWYETPTRVLDLERMQPVDVPDHEADSVLVNWLSERYLLRMVFTEEPDARHVHLYSFRDGTERKVPAAGNLSAGGRRPISPDGRYVALIESEQDGSAGVLRVWDIETWSDRLRLETPEGVSWGTAGPGWSDEETIVLCGRSTADRAAAEEGGEDREDGREHEPTRLHVLRVDPETGASRTVVSEPASAGWLVGPNLRFAVATQAGEEAPGGLTVLDLSKGRRRRIAGPGNGPFFCASAPVAFRVREAEGEKTLMRLDLERGTERAVAAVPERVSLAGVSPEGRRALFEPNGTLVAADLLVINVGTGSRQWVHLPGIVVPSLPWYRFTADVPQVSPFSPDGRWMVYQPMNLPPFKTWLCRVPRR